MVCVMPHKPKIGETSESVAKWGEKNQCDKVLIGKVGEGHH